MFAPQFVRAGVSAAREFGDAQEFGAREGVTIPVCTAFILPCAGEGGVVRRAVLAFVLPDGRFDVAIAQNIGGAVSFRLLLLTCIAGVVIAFSQEMLLSCLPNCIGAIGATRGHTRNFLRGRRAILYTISPMIFELANDRHGPAWPNSVQWSR